MIFRMVVWLAWLVAMMLWATWRVVTSPLRGLRWLFRDQDRLRTIAAIAGALWAFWLYYVHVKDKQVEQTLKYVERLQSEELAQHKAKLDGYWTTLDGVGTLFTSSDVELRARAVTRVQKEGLDKDLAAVVSFYSEVALCTRSGLCDKETACAYFLGSSHSLFEIYHPIVEIWGLAARADLLKEIRQFREVCKRPSFISAALAERGLPSSGEELEARVLRALPDSWCPRAWQAVCKPASPRKAGP